MKKDRISQLPDGILQTILSFMELKQAVQTSVLSKRWKKLWFSMPNLDFDFRSLALRSGLDLDSGRHNDILVPRFTRFLIEFLSHRDDSSTISKFRLSTSQMTPADSRIMEKCVDYAINHGVQHLDLDLYCNITSPFKFPDGFFTSKTLTKLRLIRRYCTDCIVIPKPFFLPNLKALHLEKFAFKDDCNDLYHFSKEPFSGFPNLEELTLHRCDVSGLIISGSELRILEISFQDSMLFSREAKMEEISARGVTSFRYEGYVSLVCPKVDFPCLEEVYLDVIAVLEPPYTYDIERKMPQNLIRILQQLGNAKFVSLTLETVEVLAMNPHLLEQSPSPFPNLKSLKFTQTRPWRSQKIDTMPGTVMNYLTKGSSYVR